MESCGFQSQLLSVMEVLAKAAVEEINRRVEDSCAVLRLEVNRSRRDIELLKNKCELMEAELRRSRLRARRRAGDRCSPLVKVILSKQTPIIDWDTAAEAEASGPPQQRAILDAHDEAENVQIKEECAEEDEWKNNEEDRLMSAAEPSSPPQQPDGFVDRYRSAQDPAEPEPEPEPLVSPTDGYDSLPPEQPVVKREREEEPEEKASVAMAGHGQLWLSSLRRDADNPSVSYEEQQQGEQIPAVFSHPEEVLARTPLAGKSHSVLVRVKRRARTFGSRRPQVEDGPNAQMTSTDRSSIPQLLQHQRRDLAPPSLRRRDEDLNPNAAASSSSSSCGLSSRGSFGLARRMRTPWRPGLGEKRFSCSFCDKSFVRFSQLKEHLRSHTGEKPYSCAQCGRSFTKQCNLLRHAVVHSGEKPHECSLCGKCFTQRSSLKSHQKTAH